MDRNLGDCPYDGICTCRATKLKKRADKCKHDSVKWVDGNRRKVPISQKGIK